MADHCRSCGTAGSSVFHRVAGVPVANSALLDSADEAAAVTTGDLEIACCGACGFIQNSAFDDSLVSYTDGYEDTQAHSARFVEFATDLSRDLVERHGLQGARALEIGCGKGDFLRLFCGVSGGSGIGYDPAVGPGALDGDGSRVELRQEAFTSKTPVDADVVLCRHTLEHIAEVRDFVSTVAEAVAGSDPLVFFEVPDATRILGEGAFWDLYYEHCSYFTRSTLVDLFESCGFVVQRCTYGYDGQYLLLEARIGEPGESVPDDGFGTVGSGSTTLAETREFADRVTNLRKSWRGRIITAEEKEEAMVIWGGGSKAVSFMSETGVAGMIDAVVDINPRKHGRFLPGSAKQVVAPEELTRIHPDLIIVMNPVYSQEIAEQALSLGLTAEVAAL